ncbi:MAG: hypothetical protein ACRDO2_07145 [Nocardioidaceae bacterium]
MSSFASICSWMCSIRSICSSILEIQGWDARTAVRSFTGLLERPAQILA